MHIAPYNPFTNPQTGMYFNGMRGLRGLGDATDPNTGAAIPADNGIFSTLGPALTAASQGYAQIVTAQQTNQGISTLSQVAIWGIAAFAVVKIFGKK
jgi:hypothetical protein